MSMTFKEYLEESEVEPSLGISIFDMTFSKKAEADAKKIAKKLSPTASKEEVDAAVADAVKTMLKKGRATTDIKNALIKNHKFPKSIQGVKED